MEIADKRICITGGKGFLGSHLVNKFKEFGYRKIFVADIDEYDFRDLNSVKKMYEDINPDIVVHLAARVGGSFDVIAGNAKLAPAAIRRLEFEFVYRLIKEPKR